MTISTYEEASSLAEAQDQGPDQVTILNYDSVPPPPDPAAVRRPGVLGQAQRLMATLVQVAAAVGAAAPEELTSSGSEWVSQAAGVAAQAQALADVLASEGRGAGGLAQAAGAGAGTPSWLRDAGPGLAVATFDEDAQGATQSTQAQRGGGRGRGPPPSCKARPVASCSRPRS